MAIGAKPKLQTSHTKFSILFSVLLYVICNAANADKLTKWFYQKDGFDYFAFGAYFLAGACLLVFFVILLAHRWTIKPLAIVLVVCSGAITYFISKYNVAIDTSMVRNAIHTDSTEVGQLLSAQMVPYVLFLILVPMVAISSVRVTFEPAGRYLLASLKVAGVALLLAITCLYLQYNDILRAGNTSKKYILYSLVPLNFVTGTINAMAKGVRPYITPSKRDVHITGQITSKENLVVVLAIGESSRRKNFSVYGYERRNTTPLLEQIPDLHLLNGVATRGSTLYALPKILEKDGIKLTTVVSKLGIPTACLVNYTLYDNCEAVGEITPKKCNHDGKCYDEDVIPLLEEKLKAYTSGYQFLVLHLGGGSHGPVYSDRYPPEFQQFKPMCNDADVANQCTLEQVYNSYDNTILYVDHVVGSALQTLERSQVPYVFIYLSDHGESLLEEGRMFHGVPPGIPLPPEQAQIPLIVKSSVPISIQARDEYGQPDVFDTVLKLLSIQTPMIQADGSFINMQSAPARLSANEKPNSSDSN